MANRNEGLGNKYEVRRLDGRAVNWCFVLQDTDPFAIAALTAYYMQAEAYSYDALADDLRVKIEELRAYHRRDPHVCGDLAACHP